MDGTSWSDESIPPSSLARAPPIGSESDTSDPGEMSSPRNCPSPDYMLNGKDSVSQLRSKSQEARDGYRRRSTSMAEVRDHAAARLQTELKKAQEELKLKDEECEKLAHVRDQMGEELEELTASLFEEANKMVQDANIKRMNAEKLQSQAEKLHKDDEDKISVLEAEVKALKELVLTSTPSNPNKHLHPQLDKNDTGNKSPKLKFTKGHKRSTSHHDISRETSKAEVTNMAAPGNTDDRREIDVTALIEFKTWRGTCDMCHDNSFIARLLLEDIMPCLNFPNKELSQRVLDNVESNTLTIEPIPLPSQTMRRCSVTQTENMCKHRIKFGDVEPWYDVSEMVRNRIAAVCELFTYIRYIKQGLVKHADTEIYWHIQTLKRQMALARLGFSS